jgi:hypothetical protein
MICRQSPHIETHAHIETIQPVLAMAALQLFFLDVIEDHAWKVSRPSWVVDFCNLALLVDEQGYTPGHLCAPMMGRAIVHSHLHAGVGQQRKRKVVVLCELRVRGNPIVAAAKDANVFRGELRTQAFKGPPLGGCAGDTW